MSILKFELEELVFYISLNKVRSGTILARAYVDGINSQTAKFVGTEKTVYKTPHGIFTEEEIFSTKDALLKSL